MKPKKLKFEGINKDRLVFAGERAFVQEWKKINQRVRWLNGGYGSLELILNKEPSSNTARGIIPKQVSPVTQRDADVATAVIQWLGTSCGDAFLRDCHKRIEKLRVAEQKRFDKKYNRAMGRAFKRSLQK
jgi:hypothetical protein